ncbi:hypothetical protein LEL_04953 [Akanthomyces lecanii RCEF 1005]|uniref:Uncharacterized protein n=1 Tax=Akanthomyces lecanii RCEF 1005 TaxID=1081108 RepID=A0A168HR97_CORDF|nr:hypothetical protein LEL_04953 [Akanthomyces lecanii RCEF 1005]
MSLPAKRKGAGEEAADDVVGQPGSTVKRQRTDEAGTATGIIKQEEPSTSHINVTATKMESPTRLQKQRARKLRHLGHDRGAKRATAATQRRSAAPSPFASARSAQRRLIGLQDIPSVLASVLVPGASNPGRCPCGHYLFYAVCTHVCRTEAFKCGARRARSGAAVFCAVPAPRHNVDECIVNQPCPHCLDPSPVVLLGQ